LGDSFTPAWLRGEARATELLPRAFTDASGRRAAVGQAARRGMRPEVHAALVAQEARRPRSEPRRANLEALARPGAVAVVTGQQVGLFLGPLYTLHKAVAAVVDARALAAETGREVVPVFWLQTEDADFEEIRTVSLPGADGTPRTIALDDALGPDGERVSLAHRHLGAGVTRALEALGQGLEGSRCGGEVTELLARHYRPERTLGDAFAGVMAELFADTGLVLIDPRAAELAPYARPTHDLALRRAGEIARALRARAGALEAAGFRVQVPIRPGAALSCYHPDGPRGPRYRLVPGPEAGTWEAAGDGRVYSTEALLGALDEDPLTFSTTALLRPLLQDDLLPTAAYVGGPGELSYFAELPPLYGLWDRPMPMPVPRARFRLLGPAVRRLVEHLGLTPDDAGRPRQELLAELGGRADAALDVDRLEAQLRADVEAAAAAVVRAGAPLAPSLPKAATKDAELALHALGRLFDRYRRAVARADEVTSERLTRFQGLLAPNGAPQERVYGFASFAAQVGPRRLVEALFAAARPFSPDLLDVDP